MQNEICQIMQVPRMFLTCGVGRAIEIDSMAMESYFGRLNTVDNSVICASDIPSGMKPMLRAHI